MKHCNTLGGYAAWFAVVGFCFPATSLAGDKPMLTPQRGAIVDIALAPGGVLTGWIVNAHGQPVPNIPISVRHANQEVARATTSQDGTYRIHNLRGGVYHVESGNGTRLCRLWASQTAPPFAQKGLIVVSDPDVILAQFPNGPMGTFLENAKYTLTNPLVIGGIVAAAVAIPVAIHNSDDDEPSGS